MTERVYGVRSNSYGVAEKEDGWMELRVHHQNAEMRKYLHRHINDSGYFLERLNAYATSNLAAKRWLAKVIEDYRSYFEQGRVKIVFKQCKDPRHYSPHGGQLTLDYDEALKQLLQSQYITKSSLSETPPQQGAYVLWLHSDPIVCLKVGIAGPRKEKGLKGRLQLHFLSHLANSVLARHLAADSTSGWAKRYDFRQREQRQEFLDAECFFQTIELPDLSRKELKQFENFIIERLKPRYTGRVDKIERQIS